MLAHYGQATGIRHSRKHLGWYLDRHTASLPDELRRRVLLAYLGFPFYDAATLPLLQNEGLTEFDAVKVDRISPEDCSALTSAGGQRLKGALFNAFGAFFSRAYRENDYLWGRLHGVERMIDLVASALPRGMMLDPAELARFKHDAFLAVLDQEEPHLKADPGLVPGVRAGRV